MKKNVDKRVLLHYIPLDFYLRLRLGLNIPGLFFNLNFGATFRPKHLINNLQGGDSNDLYNHQTGYGVSVYE